MKFIPYKYYVHDKFLDVCCWILKAFYVPENGKWKLKVEWCRWYKYNNKIMHMGFSSRFEVDEEAIKAWRYLNVEGGVVK